MDVYLKNIGLGNMMPQPPELLDIDLYNIEHMTLKCETCTCFYANLVTAQI